MKNILTLFILFGVLLTASAQKPNFEWVATMGESDYDQTNAVAVDKSGNVYSTGYFLGKVDFDPSPSATSYLTSNGKQDIFICKLDANGKFVWAVNIGRSADEAGNAICVNASGNICVTGFFQDTVDFDPGSSSTVLSSNGGKDIFVCQFDASGKFVWASGMGGSSEDIGNGVAVSGAGYVYTTGFFSGTVDFDPSPKGSYSLTSAGGKDIFVLNLDGKGNYVWADQMGGNADDIGFGIALDSLGTNVFTTGSFSSTADFDPDPKSTVYLSSVNDIDIFVCKLGAKGNYSWAVSTGSSGKDEGRGIAVDGNGNAYSTGYYESSPDFDPGTGKGQVYTMNASGGTDVYVWKLSSSGGFVWAKSMGGTYEDKGGSIYLDDAKGVYTTGIFSDVADFDPSSSTSNITSNGSWDVFISKLDVSGSYLWAYGLGNADADGGTSIFVDNLKSVYVAGGFVSTKMDFDPGSGTQQYSPVGTEDGFVLKLSLCKASRTDLKVAACNSYSFNGNTYYKSGDYSTKLKNSTGCDSVVNLKLTVNTTTIQTLYESACKSYTLNGITYTTAGSHSQTLVNKAGCDSFLLLELTFLNTAGTLNTKSCDTYQLNGQTYTASGKYNQTIKNKAGCDSAITLNLTILKTTASKVTKVACDEYSSNGKAYTASGMYAQTIINAAGCDSNITLDLTINHSTAFKMDKEACHSFSLNGKTYNKSGNYLQTLKNSKGCDSNITLNLSINNSFSEVKTTACKHFVFHNKVYTESGTYNQIIPNAKGCDSSITLQLTVNKVLTTVTPIDLSLHADANGAIYQWLDCNKNMAPILGEEYKSFFPKKTGDYAVSVTQNSCTDTSQCYHVQLAGIDQALKNHMEVYPNPASEVLNVYTANPVKDGELTIIDLSGKIIGKLENLNGNHFPLNLSAFAKGMYFIELKEGEKSNRVKFHKK